MKTLKQFLIDKYLERIFQLNSDNHICSRQNSTHSYMYVRNKVDLNQKPPTYQNLNVWQTIHCKRWGCPYNTGNISIYNVASRYVN